MDFFIILISPPFGLACESFKLSEGSLPIGARIVNGKATCPVGGSRGYTSTGECGKKILIDTVKEVNPQALCHRRYIR
jgi:hypothetical protein